MLNKATYFPCIEPDDHYKRKLVQYNMRLIAIYLVSSCVYSMQTHLHIKVTNRSPLKGHSAFPRSVYNNDPFGINPACLACHV